MNVGLKININKCAAGGAGRYRPVQLRRPANVIRTSSIPCPVSQCSRVCVRIFCATYAHTPIQSGDTRNIRGLRGDFDGAVDTLVLLRDTIWVVWRANLELLGFWLGLVCVSCANAGKEPGGADECRLASKTSLVEPGERSPLGFSPDEFMSSIARVAQPVVFEWTNDRAAPLFAAYAITTDAPSSGTVPALVSITRSNSARWIDGGRSCISYMEVDVEYSINTEGGELRENVPLTLKIYNRDLPASASLEVEVGDLRGTFRATVDPTYVVRARLALIVENGRPFGGLALLVHPAQPSAYLSVSQILIGSWQ